MSELNLISVSLCLVVLFNIYSFIILFFIVRFFSVYHIFYLCHLLLIIIRLINYIIFKTYPIDLFLFFMSIFIFIYFFIIFLIFVYLFVYLFITSFSYTIIFIIMNISHLKRLALIIL